MAAVSTLDKLKSSAADVATYPVTATSQLGAGLVGYNKPVSSTPFYDASVRNVGQNPAKLQPGILQKVGAAAGDVLTLPLRGLQGVGNLIDPTEVPAVSSYTPFYDRVRGMVPPEEVATSAKPAVQNVGKPTIQPAAAPVVAPVSPVATTQPVQPYNPSTPEQQGALQRMGVTRDRVVNPGAGMTLEAARTAQAKAPTNKFYELTGYGDQNSVYASAGKNGALNTFTGAGTGKTSFGMPTPEQAAQAQALAQKDIDAVALRESMAKLSPLSQRQLALNMTEDANKARLATEGNLAVQGMVGKNQLAEQGVVGKNRLDVQALANEGDIAQQRVASAAALEAKKLAAKQWKPVTSPLTGKMILMNEMNAVTKVLMPEFAEMTRSQFPDATDAEITKAYKDYLETM